jgi:hypothetical protein
MPENSESTKLVIHASSSNSSIMASAKVGNGFGRPIASSSRELQVRNNSSGLLHQMGGSKGIGKYHSTNNSEILLAKHNLQIQSAKGANC